MQTMYTDSFEWRGKHRIEEYYCVACTDTMMTRVIYTVNCNTYCRQIAKIWPDAKIYLLGIYALEIWSI